MEMRRLLSFLQRCERVKEVYFILVLCILLNFELLTTRCHYYRRGYFSRFKLLVAQSLGLV